MIRTGFLTKFSAHGVNSGCVVLAIEYGGARYKHVGSGVGNLANILDPHTPIHFETNGITTVIDKLAYLLEFFKG